MHYNKCFPAQKSFSKTHPPWSAVVTQLYWHYWRERGGRYRTEESPVPNSVSAKIPIWDLQNGKRVLYTRSWEVHPEHLSSGTLIICTFRALHHSPPPQINLRVSAIYHSCYNSQRTNWTENVGQYWLLGLLYNNNLYEITTPSPSYPEGIPQHVTTVMKETSRPDW